jgi:tetratricopeptide (TPR) repeat protein
MRDMLSFLRDKEILVHQKGSWVLTQDVAEVRKVIPTGTQNMIRLVIEQFSTMDRRILQCAAVQGIEFDSAVISQVLALDPAEVEDRLQAIERIHRFVHSVEEQDYPDQTLSIRYRFIHVFYQNALYADLALTRRASHSRAIARSLIDLTGGLSRGMAAEIALLFESARDNESASQYFLKAARHAASVFAYPEVVILCERGLRALLSLPESRERDSQELVFSLTLAMAQMATCGYAAPEVEKTHHRSRELCLRLNEKRRLVRVLWGLHTCYVNAGELIPALELSKEMRQAAEELGDPEPIMESLHALGTTLAFMGNLPDAREALEKIFTICPIGQHMHRNSLRMIDPGVTSLSMLARLRGMMGFLNEAVEKADASVDLANQLAHPPSLAYATFWVGWVHHTRGEHSEACLHLEAAMALGRAHALPQILEWGRALWGSSMTHLGKVTEGIAELRKSLDNQVAMRCLLERSYGLTMMAEALLLVNGYDEALVLCDDALRIAKETQGKSYEAETHRIRGEALLAMHNPAGPSPEIDFQIALATARKTQCRSLELRAAISLYRFKRDCGELAEFAALAETVAWFNHSNAPWVAEARRLLKEDLDTLAV